MAVLILNTLCRPETHLSSGNFFNHIILYSDIQENNYSVIKGIWQLSKEELDFFFFFFLNNILVKVMKGLNTNDNFNTCCITTRSNSLSLWMYPSLNHLQNCMKDFYTWRPLYMKTVICKHEQAVSST